MRVFHRPASGELSVSSTFAPGRELFVELKAPRNEQLLLFQNVAAATVCTAVRMYQSDFFRSLRGPVVLPVYAVPFCQTGSYGPETCYNLILLFSKDRYSCIPAVLSGYGKVIMPPAPKQVIDA